MKKHEISGRTRLLPGAVYLLKRTFFSILFVGLFIVPVSMIRSGLPACIWPIGIGTLAWTFIVASGQQETVRLSSAQIVLEKRSLLPFLRKLETIEMQEVESMHLISDQTSNDKGWQLFERCVKNVLLLNLNDGSHRRIYNSAFRGGVKALKDKISEIRSTSI